MSILKDLVDSIAQLAVKGTVRHEPWDGKDRILTDGRIVPAKRTLDTVSVQLRDIHAFARFVSMRTEQLSGGVAVIVGVNQSTASTVVEDGGVEKVHSIATLTPRQSVELSDRRFGAMNDAIIWLRRTFKDSPDLVDLLALVSNITNADEQVLADDGVSQLVTTKVGVLKKANTLVKNSYSLIPHDVYMGVEDASRHTVEVFFRIDEDGDFLFTFINGPSWIEHYEAIMRATLMAQFELTNTENITVC